VASWRWLRWPDCEETRFCPPVIYDPLQAFVHWIDEDMKEETMDAKRSGKTFPEVNRIFDDYRYPDSIADTEPVEETETDTNVETQEEVEP
jgi:microcin C transport system substrate-binding protein